jgi:hypothetical protein
MFFLSDSSSGIILDDSVLNGQIMFIYSIASSPKNIASTQFNGIECSSVGSYLTSFSIKPYELWIGIKYATGEGEGGWKFRMLGT